MRHRAPTIAVNGVAYADVGVRRSSDRAATAGHGARRRSCGGEAARPADAGDNVGRASAPPTRSTPTSLVLVRDCAVRDAGAGRAAVADGAPDPRAGRPRPPTGRARRAARRTPTRAGRLTRTAGTLDPVVVDGWQQGWRLADAAGDGRRRASPPTRAYRAGLLGRAAWRSSCCAWRCWPGRRRRAGGGSRPARRRGALHARRAPRCSGPGAALCSPGWRASRLAVRRGACSPWLPRRASQRRGPGSLAAARARPRPSAYVVRPWGSSDGLGRASCAWPHYLVLVALVPAARRAARRDLAPAAGPCSRIAGSSTSGRASSAADQAERPAVSDPDLAGRRPGTAASPSVHITRCEHRQVDAEDAVGDVAEVPRQASGHQRVA